jgi:hypothetical protein
MRAVRNDVAADRNPLTRRKTAQDKRTTPSAAIRDPTVQDHRDADELRPHLSAAAAAALAQIDGDRQHAVLLTLRAQVAKIKKVGEDEQARLQALADAAGDDDEPPQSALSKDVRWMSGLPTKDLVKQLDDTVVAAVARQRRLELRYNTMVKRDAASSRIAAALTLLVFVATVFAAYHLAEGQNLYKLIRFGHWVYELVMGPSRGTLMNEGKKDEYDMYT